MLLFCQNNFVSGNHNCEICLLISTSILLIPDFKSAMRSIRSRLKKKEEN